MEDNKPKYYKVLVTSTYVCEKIVKANSKDDVWNRLDEITSSMDLLDDVPDVETDVYVREDMDDDDVEIDLTTEE